MKFDKKESKKIEIMILKDFIKKYNRIINFFFSIDTRSLPESVA